MRFLSCLVLLLLICSGAEAYTFDPTPVECAYGHEVNYRSVGGRLCDYDGVLHPIKRPCSPTSKFVFSINPDYTRPDKTTDYSYAHITCWNDKPGDPVCAEDEFLYSILKDDVSVVECRKFEKKFCEPGYVEVFSPDFNYSCETPGKIDPAIYCTNQDLAPYTRDTFNTEFKRICRKYSE